MERKPSEVRSLRVWGWVKMLNNGIRPDPIEKRFEPGIEGSKGINYVNIRSIPGERTAHPKKHGCLATWTCKRARVCID